MAERNAAYAHSVFENVLEWYRNADAKAQVILGVDAAFLSLLTGSVFAKSDDLRSIVRLFGVETWLFLVAMVLTLGGSIFSAIECIRSRLSEPEDIEAQLRDAGAGGSGELPAPLLWFFGHIARLDRRRFERRLQALSEEDEVEALASEAYLLARNVVRKHLWVNRGFLLAAITFVLFLAAGASYVVRVQLAS